MITMREALALAPQEVTSNAVISVFVMKPSEVPSSNDVACGGVKKGLGGSN